MELWKQEGEKGLQVEQSNKLIPKLRKKGYKSYIAVCVGIDVGVVMVLGHW